MFASFLITLREGLEASLIVGIVMGYIQKTDQTRYKAFAWAGVIAALLFSLLVAVGIQIAGAELEGSSEQIFEGTMMLLAAVVLTWMIFWMRYQARHLKSELEEELALAAARGNGRGLFAVTFFAVAREGVETALFLSAAAFSVDALASLSGAILGLLVSIGLGFILYTSTVRLDIRKFFSVTSILLLLFAAGLVAHGVHEFQEASILPVFIEHLWDMNHILDENSLLGEMMKTLFGYNGNPSLLEILSYIGYILGAVFIVPRVVEIRTNQQNATVSKPMQSSIS